MREDFPHYQTVLLGVLTSGSTEATFCCLTWWRTKYIFPINKALWLLPINCSSWSDGSPDSCSVSQIAKTESAIDEAVLSCSSSNFRTCIRLLISRVRLLIATEVQFVCNYINKWNGLISFPLIFQGCWCFWSPGRKAGSRSLCIMSI